ncbi:pheromone-regulated membrane protein 10 [Nannizzia gypsea CBS 118893]|uniref:Pheromone-regulated membrane protein 10 n=1 Tax=Arthroderma gypseum (strain ATCC MYA-4604 / CBS 118893) TaxID=535722 RepID=E5R125_ARTGP|nr:pheromone-regulated membrane protein 10 [Nannizzia gypsea CBS 118893]EFQ97629.1 pheromone-regulated membrane protein 10 [Nannizzia gypsea CBS 118893]
MADWPRQPAHFPNCNPFTSSNYASRNSERQPQQDASPKTSPRLGPAIHIRDMSNTSDNNDARERPFNRVKFTLGSDGSDSSSEEIPLRDYVDSYTPPEPQAPAFVHRPSLPTFKSSEFIPMYKNRDSLSAQSSPRASPVPTPLGSPGRPPSPISTAQSTESSKTKNKAIQAAYEKAQNLASQVRRASYFHRRRRSDEESLSQDLIEPHHEGRHYIGRSASGSKAAYEHEKDRARQFTLRAEEANGIVKSIRARAEPKSRRHYSIDTESSGSQSPPVQHGRSILTDILRLGQLQEAEANRTSQQQIPTPQANTTSPLLAPHSAPTSGKTTPGKSTPRPKWYEKNKNPSALSLNTLGSEATLTGGCLGAESAGRPELKRSRSSGLMVNAVKKICNKPRLEDEIRLTVHIAETISRQRYLEKLCDALMAYGAPTHRLEECLRMTSRVLELDAQFLYLPGCMFVSFNDTSTHTTSLKLQRCDQGVDLGKLQDVHQIYKDVVHDMIGVEEAMQLLEEPKNEKPRYNVLTLIFLFGLASAAVGPFAFTGRVIDLPVSFALGCILGALKYIAVPRSRLYANIFELTAAMLLSFLARAIGSIRHGPGDDRLFCFPALAQSSIALILPGFMVLCSSLELQSQNILAGSVRLVYAIIYSLVLGFGMMLGTTFYGKIDHDASSAYVCPTSPSQNEYAHNFPSVIAFTVCLTLINQAKWKQVPVMALFSFIGYLVNFFSSKAFPRNLQIANCMGAFAIGIMGNLYSRLGHGLAAAAMLPGILVQVPSGLAASGSLVSGLAFANQANSVGQTAANQTASAATSTIASAATTAIASALAGHPGGSGNPSDAAFQDLAARIGSSKVYGDVVFDLAYAMIQVSISTTVGLFLAALIIYPEGKRRSELFSF